MACSGTALASAHKGGREKDETNKGMEQMTYKHGRKLNKGSRNENPL
jgi:hypothetical protein